jgi:hypothetical protein
MISTLSNALSFTVLMGPGVENSKLGFTITAVAVTALVYVVVAIRLSRGGKSSSPSDQSINKVCPLLLSCVDVLACVPVNRRHREIRYTV